MSLPHFGHVGYVGSFLLLVAAVFLVLNTTLWFVPAIRRDPQDRVLRFDALALGTLSLGIAAPKTVRFLAARLPYLADPVLWPYRMCGLFRRNHGFAAKETPELKGGGVVLPFLTFRGWEPACGQTDFRSISSCLSVFICGFILPEI
jgi:hypothetical protein